MADTLGGSTQRQKICYDNDGIQACNEYFGITDLKTNKTEWHRDDKFRAPAFAGWSLGETTVIGVYDPKTKKFTPNDKATKSQAKYFTSNEGQKHIANSTITSNTKSLRNLGKNSEEAQQQAEEISKGNYSHPTEDNKEDTKPASDDPDVNPESGENKEGTRNNFGKYMYPLTLGETTQDILKIDMLEYRPQSIDENKKFGSTGRKKGTTIGSVILPIPGGIKDSNKAEWGDDKMNSLQMAAANFAKGAIQEGATGADAELSKIGNSMKSQMGKGGGNLNGAISSWFTAAAVGKDFSKLMSRTEGQIMNPNMELLFNGPSLRPFSFSFLLAPRSKEEAKQVVQIIRFFKQGMAPIRSQANLFLKSPHTFQLQYKHRGAEHPYLNKFKECALQSCDINYTPQNNYSTFEDGVMNAYSMTLSFQELEPVYNDDYGKENIDGKIPAEIGF